MEIPQSGKHNRFAQQSRDWAIYDPWGRPIIANSDIDINGPDSDGSDREPRVPSPRNGAGGAEIPLPE